MRALGLVGLLWSSIAHAGVATFDALPEGDVFRSYTEDGVTVSDMTNLVDPPPGVMVSERADGNLAGMPGFTPNVVLGFGGYVPGTGVAFGQFGGLTVRGTGPNNHGRVEIFHLGNGGNTLRLEAIRLGAVVATDSVDLNSWGGVTHDMLEVSGVRFDRLRLVSGVPGTPAPCWVSLDTIQVDWNGGPLPVDTGDTGGGDTDVAVDTDVAPDTGPVVETSSTPDTDDAPDTDTTRDTDDVQPVVDTDPIPQADTDLATNNRDTDPFSNGTVFLEQRCGCDTSSRSPWLPAVIGLIALRRRRSPVG